MRLRWTEALQTFSVDEKVFTHEGSIVVNPSHDLAHLILAAHDKPMPWWPTGPAEFTRVSEYNAIFLENLCGRAVDVVRGTVEASNLVSLARAAVDRLVTELYAPFPLTVEEAARRFARDVDPVTVLRLFPLFDRMRTTERNRKDHRRARFELGFMSDSDLRPDQDTATAKASAILERALSEIAGSSDTPGVTLPKS